MLVMVMLLVRPIAGLRCLSPCLRGRRVASTSVWRLGPPTAVVGGGPPTKGPHRRGRNNPDGLVSTRTHGAPSTSPDEFAMSSSSSKDDDDDAEMIGERGREWLRLGLGHEVTRALLSMKLTDPSEIQRRAIPAVLARENVMFAAETGSGKTLAYLAPIFAMLKAQETVEYVERVARRPRCLVLVPTRELGQQVLGVAKELAKHGPRVSCRGAVGGSDGVGKQSKALGGAAVDVVVASPGRFLQLWRRGDVFTRRVRCVVVDEVDTMLTQGFGEEIREILKATVLFPAKKKQRQRKEANDFLAAGLANVPSSLLPKIPTADEGAQLVVTTATMTKAVRRALCEDDAAAKGKDQRDPRWTFVPRLRLIESAGAHKPVGSLRRVDVDVAGRDKLTALVDLFREEESLGSSSEEETSSLGKNNNDEKKTVVFCNTLASCRAVDFALREEAVVGGDDDVDDDDFFFSSSRSVGDDDYDDDDDDEAWGLTTTADEQQQQSGGGAQPVSKNSKIWCYHGDMNSRQREQSLIAFRAASPPAILVCTDLAARGLDVPDVDHVINFDFPRNPIDYLHRVGRTARFGRAGTVTSLVAKRDRVLAAAIADAVDRGDRIDGLTANKRDYVLGHKLDGGGRAAAAAKSKKREEKRLLRVKTMKKHVVRLPRSAKIGWGRTTVKTDDAREDASPPDALRGSSSSSKRPSSSSSSDVTSGRRAGRPSSSFSSSTKTKKTTHKTTSRTSGKPSAASRHSNTGGGRRKDAAAPSRRTTSGGRRR